MQFHLRSWTLRWRLAGTASWLGCGFLLKPVFWYQDGNRPLFAGRTVDSLDGRDVAQPLHSVSFRVAPATDAVREGIQFKNELIDHLEPLLEPSALYLAKETALLLEGESRIQRRPTLFPVHLHEGRGDGAITRGALAHQAVGVGEPK